MTARGCRRTRLDEANIVLAAQRERRDGVELGRSRVGVGAAGADHHLVLDG
jgi:hypothetical protein